MALGTGAENTTTVTMREAAAVPIAARATNPLAAGPGYKILNNHIQGTRSRGIIAKSDDGSIQGNLIEYCDIAVQLGPEYYWNEATYVRGARIENNTFRNNGVNNNMTILVRGEGTKGNRDIIIADNVFDKNAGANIVLEWTDGAQIINNRFVATHARPVGDSDVAGSVISVSHSNNVRLSGNTVRNSGADFKTLLLVGDDVTDLQGGSDGLTRHEAGNEKAN